MKRLLSRWYEKYIQPFLVTLLTHPFAVKAGLVCYVAAKNERAALEMAVVLHTRKLGVISDILGEEVKTKDAAVRAAKVYIRHLRHLAALRKSYPDIRLAISMKLSQLGLKFDIMLCRRLVFWIFREAVAHGVQLEVDMEGPETIDATMNVVRAMVRHGNNFRVAIPANQKKSERCIRICFGRGIGVRIVRGAYPGDIQGNKAIGTNFLRLVAVAKEYAPLVDCAIGTHHRKRIRYSKEIFSGIRIQMLWGIRMFLQEKVAEWTYMPWGKDEDAGPFYVRRVQEGMEPNVIVLFGLNFFESLLWRALRAPKTFWHNNQ